ncbi:MAG: cupin domain-containing protein [Candidatus Marinimicrobia bacterium]|nr:cupin domain-containing protein [Candidatus Neomarinimicrobiota bacterium]
MENSVVDLKQVAHFSEEAARVSSMFKSDQLQMDVLLLNSHQYLSPRVEPISDIIYFVLRGEGVFEVGDEVLVLTRNTSVLVEMGVSSGIINENDEQLTVLKIAAPPGIHLDN